MLQQILAGTKPIADFQARGSVTKKQPSACGDQLDEHRVFRGLLVQGV
jgi:hypothetical protein